MVIKFISDLIHTIRHKLGWYNVNIISWREGQHVYIGAECTKCKHVDRNSIVKIKVNDNEHEYLDSEA